MSRYNLSDATEALGPTTTGACAPCPWPDVPRRQMVYRDILDLQYSMYVETVGPDGEPASLQTAEYHEIDGHIEVSARFHLVRYGSGLREHLISEPISIWFTTETDVSFTIVGEEIEASPPRFWKYTTRECSEPKRVGNLPELAKALVQQAG